MGAILDSLRTLGIERSRAYPDELFALRGLWRIDHRYRPNQYERMLNYSIILAQTTVQGACYSNYNEIQLDPDPLLGRDVRDLVVEPLAVQIAIVDSMYGVFGDAPDEEHSFSGNSDEKAIRRAEIVVDETMRVLDSVGGKRVLNIGVMGNFVQQLVEQGIEVVGSDFDEDIVSAGPGSAPAINNATMKHGRGTLDYIEDCDVVLSTGMVLATDTLDDIARRVKECGKKLILFAATGCFFAREYCNTFGVDVVLSEPQPQYIFQGTTVIRTYRR